MSVEKLGGILYVLGGELGVSQVFLARWYIGGSYMDISEVVEFYDCGTVPPP